MTDGEISDLVLNGPCSESYRSRSDDDAPPSPNDVVEGENYHERNGIVGEIERRRRVRDDEVRSMALRLHRAGRRRAGVRVPNDGVGVDNARDEGEDDDGDVRIDGYGRLVRVVRGEEGGGNAPAVGGAGGDEDADDHRVVSGGELLEDLVGLFLMHRRSTEDDRATRARLPPPRMHCPADQQQQRRQQQQPPSRGLRDIARRMEGDAADAIRRALDRYAREEEGAGGGRGTAAVASRDGEEAHYELVRIPPDDDDRDLDLDDHDGAPAAAAADRRRRRRSPFLRVFDRDRRRRRRADGVGGGGDAEGGDDWPAAATRVAFRRICYAVVTVAAAFACIMIQGLPLDFGDDDDDVGDLFLHGLMGPHYAGHHHHRARRRAAGDDDDDDDYGEEGMIPRVDPRLGWNGAPWGVARREVPGETGEDMLRSGGVAADVPPTHTPSDIYKAFRHWHDFSYQSNNGDLDGHEVRQDAVEAKVDDVCDEK